MLRERLEDITEATLIALCEEGRDESVTLDFKRQLYTKSDDDKAEIQKDVCAFANSEGGDLVIGITDDRDRAGTIQAIQGEPAKQAERRLLDTLDAIEPRIGDLRFQAVPVHAGYVLILRVCKSLIGPHRYKNRAGKDGLSFPIRSGTRNTEMTYDQLRDAFGRTATLIEKAKAFRHERIEAILTKQGNYTLPLPSTYAAIHLISIESMSGHRAINLLELKDRREDLLEKVSSHTFNLEGLFVWYGVSERDATHCVQAFRHGALEIISRKISSQHPNHPGVIPARPLARLVRSSFDRLIRSAQKSGFSGSAVAGITLHNVQNKTLHAGDFDFEQGTTNREHLVLPEFWIESLEGTELDAFVRPQLDVIWQSFGMESCCFYDPTGQWTGDPP